MDCRIGYEFKVGDLRFVLEPSQQPWGGYMAMFADPDGKVFYLDHEQAR